MSFAEKVKAERDHQRARYGETTMSRDRWVSTIFEHAGRIAQEANELAKLDPSDPLFTVDQAAVVENLRRQLVRTAALCESWDTDISKRMDDGE